MSTRGFEFAYMLDGSNATPLIRDLVLSASAVHKVGDLVTMSTIGDVIQQTPSTPEVTGVMMEALGTADITANTTKAKVAIITRNQVWRCSMDTTSTSLYVGYSKSLDVLDYNTLDYNASSGSMVLVDKSRLDDDGNVIAYVAFTDTTFGNS